MLSLMDSRLGLALRAWPALRSASRRQHHTFHYEQVLGTSFELQVTAASYRAAQRAESAALAEVDRLEPILSAWSGTSELACWLMTRDCDVCVSPELVEVLRASEQWRVLTGGAFDPAAQAVITVLRDHADCALDEETFTTLLSAMHVPRWSLDVARGTARRRTPLAISLDAIAKGYIVARAAARARDVAGVGSVLLNIGGDIQHCGDDTMSVGIADPHAPAENAPPIAVVRLHNAALATSGGYRRGFVTNGRRVSHIVDPRTGQPAEHIASASVLAPNCATADALSTAFSVMSPRESLALADTLPAIGCLLVTHDGRRITNATWDAAATPLHATATTHGS
ncbi:MAG: FAD:protein FMN transferase [Gemmatimonadaceae bacterium]|nr:FAD:protein FMN transferase [Gemmatimonadaceae bacterium]